MNKINIHSWLFFVSLIFITGFNFTHIKSQTFSSIYSSNGSIVWVVGSGGSIFRSPNGGQTFLDRSDGSVNYNSVNGYSGLNLWIAGNSGALLVSTNAGINFSQLTVDPNEDLTCVYFVDNNSGWISCASGKIFVSSNGGFNWSQQNSTVSDHLNKIKFINSTTGFACGKNGVFIKTVNGGTSWNTLAIPESNEIFSFDVKNNTIFASSKDGKVYKSTNLGVTWDSYQFKAVIPPDIYGVYLSNDTTIYVCGEGGLIRKSTDGGIIYQSQFNPSWTDIKMLFFSSNINGVALGVKNKMVLRTINGGDNWYMPTGTTIDLNWEQKIPLNFYTSSGRVFYQSTWNKKEIFVTKANTIYRSLDIGDTWAQIGSAMPYGSISNSLFVSPKDTNIFLVAIDSIDNNHGKVLRSTDYGQSWIETFSANRLSDGIPMAMDPNHSDTIYYGTTDSSLFRSTNFGLTWSEVSPYRFENNCSIKILNNNSNVILVGSANFLQNGRSIITRSSDFGQTWTVVDSNRGPYPEVPAIIGSELDSVLYCTQYKGNEGGVKRSTNNGLSWSFINIDNTAWGFDRSGDDPNLICYAPWNYLATTPAYISYDRGMHFTELPSSSANQNFSVYFYNRNNLILQQSIGFYKLKATVSVPIGIQPVSNEIPVSFILKQNYPNPFNPSTNIRFNLPEQQEVILEVFDVLGRLVSTLINDRLKAGSYETKWSAGEFSSGIYFYKLSTEKFTETKKMILLK